MKNKLILFDWGNIVESYTLGYASPDAFLELFKRCGYKGNDDIFSKITKYNLSVVSTFEEFDKKYNILASDFGLDVSSLEFIKIYKEVLSNVYYFKDVVEYEHSLKDKCSIGILSNILFFDKDRLNKQVDLSKYDYVFLSFEMGLRKPDRKIYEEINRIVSFKPENILLIDDKLENVEMASKFGWDTLVSTGLDLEKIKQKCEKFLK